jgi:hypothetical protein
MTTAWKMTDRKFTANIGDALARKLAEAVCGDDLTCSWPTCDCAYTKRKINAVVLVVGEHIGEIENRIADALAITGAADRVEGVRG